MRPMLLTTAKVIPEDEGLWAGELKWDGYRAIAHVGEKLRILSRNGHDLTPRVPELWDVPHRASQKRAVLDGELVVLGLGGKPDFEALQARMATRKPGPGAPKVKFVAFDMLASAGTELVHLPYETRREHLAGLELGGDIWEAPGNVLGQGRALLDASRINGLEGIVLKRLGSKYRPGERSRDWLKLKNWQSERFVVGGYIADPKGRHGWPGRLLLGRPAASGWLRYVGAVELGFDHDSTRGLRSVLPVLETVESPFGHPLRGARFLKPHLVAEIRHVGQTPSGKLRQPIFCRFVRTESGSAK